MPSTASDPHSDAPAIWLLAIGVTIGYAALIYSFGALVVPVTEETGWTKPQLAWGLTLALLVAAACSPLSGRLIDKGWGAELLWGGAALGGLALVVLSQARTLPLWYLGWALAGPPMAASLYDSCFSFLTRRLGAAKARPAIIRVTLVGGFASTLAFPIGAYSAEALGWRGAALVFAAMELCLAAPLMAWAGLRLRRKERAGAVRQEEPKGRLMAATRTVRFWVILAVFACVYLDHSMLFTLFIPLFTGLGAGQAVAVAAASAVGPFQVVGRLVLMALGQRAPALLTVRAALAMLLGGTLLLLAAQVELKAIFLFAVLQGGAIGVLSILRPVLIAEQMGTEGFGAISGAITMGPLLATALAPILSAALFAAGGPEGLTLGALAVSATGLTLTLALRQRAA